MKMKKNLLLVLALLIPIVIAGCIASGTIVLVFDVDGFQSSNTTLDHRNVNLTENSDYDDHKDKIKSVDAITLTGFIVNNGSSEISAEAWISDDSTLTTVADIQNNGTLIFESPTIPAGDTLFLEWADGMQYMRNFGILEDEIKNDGIFTVYGIASGPFNLTYDLSIIISITAGL
jgi:hypothetical protein